MLLYYDQWILGYEQIKTECLASEEGQSVLLLCNADVDAIASARIFSYMLRSDNIHYQLLPCTNYSMLDQRLREVQLDSVPAVVLMNFGASRNLNRLFHEHPDLKQTKVYVLDCRRPIHLANVHAGDNIVVFIEGYQTDIALPEYGDNLSGNDSSTDEEQDDDSSDDSSSDDNSEGADDAEEEATFDDVVDVSAPRKEQTTDYDGEDEEEEYSPGRPRARDDDVGQSPKRQRTSSNLEEGTTDVEESEQDTPLAKQDYVSPREGYRRRREEIRSYYSSGSYYGSPAAFVAYEIARQVRFGEQGDLLWLACVGVTDAYLHSRIDRDGFTKLGIELRESCLKLFPSDMYERAVNTVYAEDLFKAKGSSDRTKITFSDSGRILAENDYKFFLLRHSSLLESMVHSDFVSTKLQVWTKKGMHRLQELLAKMGYPLEECRQPFAFMRPSLRRRLHEKVLEHSEEYDLRDFEFTSFFRVTGYQSLLSASDTSYAVTALLECDTTPSRASTGSLDDDKAMIDAFNLAFDALNPNVAPSVGLNGLANEGHDAASLVNGGSLSGNSGIGAGIRLAMAMQRTIISTAVSLVDRNAINRLRHFRFAYLTCTSAGESQTARSDMIRTDASKIREDAPSHLFSKPLALSRLAHYLISMHRENGKWTGNKARPLVLMAERPRTGTYLVVGYEWPERTGQLVRNKFGMNFELTAKSMNGNIRFDSFDSNVVEVDGSDVQRFIEQLHYLMDSI